MVTAWANENKLVLAQEVTQEKSNEITAIPAVLKLIDIKDSTVTIDAMGCQTNIAKQIIEQEGDYVFGLKRNQGLLHKEVKACVLEAKSLNLKKTPHSFFEVSEKSDVRKY